MEALDGHVCSCVHCSQNVKGIFTSTYGSDVHEHEHTQMSGRKWVLVFMSICMEMSSWRRTHTHTHRPTATWFPNCSARVKVTQRRPGSRAQPSRAARARCSRASRCHSGEGRMGAEETIDQRRRFFFLKKKKWTGCTQAHQTLPRKRERTNDLWCRRNNTIAAKR